MLLSRIIVDGAFLDLMVNSRPKWKWLVRDCFLFAAAQSFIRLAV